MVYDIYVTSLKLTDFRASNAVMVRLDFDYRQFARRLFHAAGHGFTNPKLVRPKRCFKLNFISTPPILRSHVT